MASTPVFSGESCHDELRGATEVLTVRFRLHDEWLHAERVRVLLQATEEEGAQLLSRGKACEAARGSPVASLLVPVASCLPSCSPSSSSWSEKGRPRSWNFSTKTPFQVGCRYGG